MYMKRHLALALFFLFCGDAWMLARSPFTLAAAPSSKQITRRRAATLSACKTATATQSRAKQVAAVAVQEIDLAGLKKLLERNPASTQTARPLLVNFWATWCPPCREEFPDLVRINNYYKTRGLDFVVVSLDDVEELNKGVPQFLRQMRATMPAYLLNATDQEAAINAVDVKWSGTLPATFLFGSDGKIFYKQMGRIQPQELRKAIDASMRLRQDDH